MTQSDENISRLETEAWNRDTSEVSSLDTLSLCRAFHREETLVLPVIEDALETIASFIDALVPRLRSGGRLVYVGAGNSGRVALMDCTELPVTFSVDPLQFLCVVPAGSSSPTGVQAPEGAEDAGEDGASALEALNLNTKDTVVGISASGRTPFVADGLKVAVSRGALTAAVTNVQSPLISKLPLDYTISSPVGAEFVTGSTRLKAGTAAKVILNMISTCTMIRLGKTYKGLMVDVCVQNEKLRHRARRIVREICRSGGTTRAVSARGGQLPGIPIPIPIPETTEGDLLLDSLIEGCAGSVKLACAVALSGLAPSAAQKRLDSVDGDLSRLIQTLSPPAWEVPISISVVPRNSERFFLAIDGGGTKCTASLAVWEGTEIITAQGTSGPCNVHCTSLPEILHRVQASTMQAAAALRRKIPMLSASFEITQAWVGIAGVDNATQSTIDTLACSLKEILQIAHDSGVLRLTSDGPLLGACFEANSHVEAALAVVAGTGSVALSFGKDTSTGETVCRGKAGGWGYLLGDEGSAFDLGKRALRKALDRMETNGGQDTDLPDLHRELLATSGCTRMDRLLPSILQAPGTVSKRMIADLAVAVTRLAFRVENPDPEAHTILRSAIEDLVQSIRRLLAVAKTPKGGAAMLILSGSLMNLAPYRTLFLEVWELEGLHPFREVVVVKDPAIVAVEMLARSCFAGI